MLNDVKTFKQLIEFIIKTHSINSDEGVDYLTKLNELMLDCAKREFLLHQIGGLSTLIMQMQHNLSQNDNDQSIELTDEAKSHIDDYTQLIKELETETNNPFV